MDVIERRRSIIASQPHKVSAAGERIFVNIGEPKISKLAVDFRPLQAGSGIPSQSNVREIVGWN